HKTVREEEENTTRLNSSSEKTVLRGATIKEKNLTTKLQSTSPSQKISKNTKKTPSEPKVEKKPLENKPVKKEKNKSHLLSWLGIHSVPDVPTVIKRGDTNKGEIRTTAEKSISPAV